MQNRVGKFYTGMASTDVSAFHSEGLSIFPLQNTRICEK